MSPAMGTAAATALAAVLVASLVGGCGGGRRAPDLAGKPADQVLAAAADALRATARFRVIVDVVDAHGVQSLTGDFHLQGQATQLDLDAAGRGYSVRTLSRDETYLRVDAATMQAGGGDPLAVGIIADRWFRYSAEQSRAAGMATVEFWANLVGHAADGGRGPVAQARLDGQPVVRVGLGGSGAAYVAAVGPPYPLRIELPAVHATYRFSEFGRAFPIEAPADATEIDQAFPGIGLVPFAGMTPLPSPPR